MTIKQKKNRKSMIIVGLVLVAAFVAYKKGLFAKIFKKKAE